MFFAQAMERFFLPVVVALLGPGSSLWLLGSAGSAVRSNTDWRLRVQSGAMRARDGLLSVSARTRRGQPAAWAEHLMLFA